METAEFASVLLTLSIKSFGSPWCPLLSSLRVLSWSIIVAEAHLPSLTSGYIAKLLPPRHNSSKEIQETERSIHAMLTMCEAEVEVGGGGDDSLLDI